MAPAHQRLHPGKVALADAEDRLKPDLDRPVGQGIGQVALGVAAHVELGAQLVIEDSVAVPAGGLGGVEGFVGADETLGQALAFPEMNADAHADPVRVEPVEGLGHRRDDGSGEVAEGHTGGGGIVEDGEFISAEAPDMAAGGYLSLEATTDFRQHLIAGLVTVDVVDRLEAVEVEQHQARSRDGAARHAHGQGLGLVLQPAGAAKVGLGHVAGAHQREEIKERGRREAIALEPAGHEQAGHHGSEGRRDKRDRDLREGRAVADGPGRDPAGHDEVEHRLLGRVGGAEEWKAGPDQPGQQGAEGHDVQPLLDGSGGLVGKCGRVVEPGTGLPAEIGPQEVGEGRGGKPDRPCHRMVRARHPADRAGSRTSRSVPTERRARPPHFAQSLRLLARPSPRSLLVPGIQAERKYFTQCTCQVNPGVNRASRPTFEADLPRHLRGKNGPPRGVHGRSGAHRPGQCRRGRHALRRGDRPRRDRGRHGAEHRPPHEGCHRPCRDGRHPQGEPSSRAQGSLGLRDVRERAPLPDVPRGHAARRLPRGLFRLQRGGGSGMRRGQRGHLCGTLPPPGPATDAAQAVATGGRLALPGMGGAPEELRCLFPSDDPCPDLILRCGESRLEGGLQLSLRSLDFSFEARQAGHLRMRVGMGNPAPRPASQVAKGERENARRRRDAQCVQGAVRLNLKLSE
ncbi:hypothetical protein Lal_00041327 [Lupinus albus]|nr:hypothetical protein Lal_00041327 [Lupinus albus]